MSKELNSLDLTVKRMMLEYPSIFPSRLECLHSLFAVNGTGCEWHKGMLVNTYDDPGPMPTKIKEAKEYDFGSAADVMDEYQKVRLEREGLIRGFTEKHIDFLCQDIHHTGSTMSWTSVYPMSWDYCAMGYAADHPYDIDPDWRMGIREFIHWFLPGPNGYYGVHNDYPENPVPQVDRIKDPRVKSNYELCVKVLKMMQTDEERKQSKLTKKHMRKLVHELRNKDA